MKHRMLALLLALVMAVGLMACSAPSAEKTDAPSASPSATPSDAPSDTIEVDLDQNIITFASGLSPEDIVATINDDPIFADFFLYWLFINTNYYVSYGISAEQYGPTLLEESLTMAAYYTLLEQKCTELGCPLTDEQQAEIQAELDEIGEETVAQQMTFFGLTSPTLYRIQSLMYHYENLMDALVPAPSEEELNNYVYQAKHILLATVDLTGTPGTREDGTYGYPYLDEETIAAKKALADDILAQLAASEDPIATFDSLMHEHSEDGRDGEGKLAAPDGYTTTTGQMVPEFEAGALALAPGQISGIVESSYGYHIILRGEVEDMDTYADTYRESKMDGQVNTWLAESDIVKSEALETLNVADFYDRFAAWQTQYSLQIAEG